MMLTTVVISAILVGLHLKYRKTYNQKFEELIRNEVIDYHQKVVEAREVVKDHDTDVRTIRIEEDKFGQFINALNKNYNS
jgi:hypothetical protein